MRIDDSGEIEDGKREDMVRVKMEGNVKIIRKVWREGKSVI